MDRDKQADKKKRRLEKALARSAAIRSELLKKKQQKKEEQHRLDEEEEGAAIAKAVALHARRTSMGNLTCKSPPVLRKVKMKKKGKFEMDRVKQAEKKKRRLEKTLATSAAIRSELEKKKEERQRLDEEEGVAIAKAVALHARRTSMGNLTRKSPPVLRKVKMKKNGKFEMDRVKHAEKKKRRLEKTLATSAAIRSELEKKKEEQHRLDEEEEGAAIAKVVALHARRTSMGNLTCKSPPVLRKVKMKKKGKFEMDRVKQAEKKKRRLEKTLATSAAIRSELEKKKQMKKEEQQRLDEETKLCPGLLAASCARVEKSEDEAISSLQIRDDANLNIASLSIGF